MELWIRSQDRDYLEKVEKIYFWEDDYGKYRIEGIGELGTYKTKERALEVLDEIQAKINLINIGHDFGSPMIDLKNPAYIYEMPKE